MREIFNISTATKDLTHKIADLNSSYTVRDNMDNMSEVKQEPVRCRDVTSPHLIATI